MFWRPTMTPDLNFWIAAWSLMAIAFITATGAIILGARGLDRTNG